ncbi:MAG: hypothetical protein ACRD10_11335 [Terriglobia bacterium]
MAQSRRGVVAALGFPAFCSGASAPLSLVKHHSVDMNLPIGCGGVAVFPNDVIVGDGDGVAVIPCHLADEIAADAAEQEGLEEFYQDAGRRRISASGDLSTR